MNAAPWRLLVVDDNEDNRYTLSRRLRREGYGDIVTAVNGKEALAALRAQPIDLVLLDIMMPDMNGFQVLEHMKADPELRQLPVIMISALEEIESVVKCIELGAEDYLPKPFNPTLLRARVGATLEKKRLRDDVRRSLRRLEQELEAARKLQAGMLPRSFPDWTPQQPVDLGALMEPAREVGGDLYDFFALDGGRLCFLVGDVSGKGAGAAMFMARARSLVRMAAEMWRETRGEAATPSAVAGIANRELCRNNDERMFVTLFLGFLDMGTGRLAYINAGHPVPYVLRAAEPPRRIAATPSLPLGVRPATAYNDVELDLSPGDAVFVFSDGVTEASHDGVELFGEARLEGELARHAGATPQQMVAAVKASVDAFDASGNKADDVTMLALRWRPAP